jgi:hypothetical protein
VALEVAREAALSEADTALSQGGPKLVQVDAGLRLVGRQDQVSMSFDPVRGLIVTHRLGRDAASADEVPAPATGARQIDPDTICRLVPGCAGLDGMDHPLP